MQPPHGDGNSRDARLTLRGKYRLTACQQRGHRFPGRASQLDDLTRLTDVLAALPFFSRVMMV